MMMATRGVSHDDYPTEPQRTPPVGGSAITHTPDPYTKPAGIDLTSDDIPDTPPAHLRWTEPRTVFAAVVMLAYGATFALGWRDRYPADTLNPVDWAFLGAVAMLFGGGGIKNALPKRR